MRGAADAQIAHMDDLLQRLAVSLALGLLVGLERGWRSRDDQPGHRAAGFRTFALSGLLGGLSGAVAQSVGPVILGLIFIGYAVVFAAFQWLEARARDDLSATSMVAGMLTFVLGAYAVVGDLDIAIAGAVATVLLLALREPLHKWVEALRWEEIRAVLTLLAMTFLLLPILPDRTVDPWDALNPAKIWILAIFIAAISFGGYVAVRLFGDRLGIIMAAVAGGLASSTATTLTLARLGRGNGTADRLLAGGILIAGCVMVVRVGGVVTLFNPALLAPLTPSLVAIAVILAAAAAVLLLGRGRAGDDAHPEIEMANPLELGMALKMAAAIAVIMVVTNAAQQFLGGGGVLAVAAISGVVDVDAVTISMAELGGGQLPLETAVHAIAIAVGVNSLSKAAMAGWVGGWRLGAMVGGASLLALAGGALMLLFAPGLPLPFVAEWAR